MKWEFDRYVRGELKAEGICIERETSEKDARAAAARMASPGDVLVMRGVVEPTRDDSVCRKCMGIGTVRDDRSTNIKCPDCGGRMHDGVRVGYLEECLRHIRDTAERKRPSLVVIQVPALALSALETGDPLTCPEARHPNRPAEGK